MSLNRREMLRLGAAGAGSVMLSSAASPNTLPALVFRTPPSAATPITPPSGPAGVNPQLFARAKAAFESRRGFLGRTDVIGIVDFSLPSRDSRFHIVDLRSGQIESHQVAHGRGSDPDHSGYLERFSNQFGSEASSNGSYMTTEHYHGKYGLSMRVRGLDWSNSNAEARAIVMHNAWYAEPEIAAAHGKLGRSEGCFAFSRENHYRVMSRLSGGALIYADKLSSAYAA